MQLAAYISNWKRMNLHFMYRLSTDYPSGFRPKVVVWFCGFIYGLANDCCYLDVSSSFYACFTVEVEERGALSPGPVLLFETSRLPVDLQIYQGHH